MLPDFSLRGKTAVITGAAGILCREMAKTLGEAGCRLVLLGRTASKVEALAEEINRGGGDAFGMGCDVTCKQDLLAAREETLKRYGGVDILINGAGGNHPKASTNQTDPMSFFGIPEDAIRSVFDLNFLGTLLPSQVFGEAMMEKKKGSILNICSMAGIRPLTRVSCYGAAKAAVANLTQWMATYFAQAGCPQLRVNAIAPGFFLTDQNRFLLTDKETGEPSPRGKHILQQTPMGRYGDASELTGAVIFLLSDAASFIDGVVLPIDGGFASFAI